MLATIFIYAIKSALVLSILYLVYRLLFQTNTHYHLKRMALLVILIAAVALPALELQTKIEAAPTEPMANYIDTIGEAMQENQASQVTDSALTINSEPINLGWFDAIIYLYWTGLTISILIFFYQLTGVLYLIAAGDTRHDLGRQLITHRQIKYPFSFWKWTFIPENFNMDSKSWSIVHEHELATYDKPTPLTCFWPHW